MSALLLSVPFIVRVLVSLALILTINKIFNKLAFAVFCGTVVLALWLGHSPMQMINIAMGRAFSQNNLFLTVIIFQVIWLSLQMDKSSSMKDLVKEVKRIIPEKFSMAVLPAIIGLLPMPGGAIFSAPLVDSCDEQKVVSPIAKTKINYWFRHIWEYWWPLYPGVLLAVDISGLPIYVFMLVMLPLSIVSVIAGYIFLIRPIGNAIKRDSERQDGSVKSVFNLVLPIIIVIAVYILIKLILPQIADFNKYMPMIIGLIAAQIMLQKQRPLNKSQWKGIIFSKKTLFMVIIVLVIRIYGAFIEAPLSDGSFLAFKMKLELDAWGIPLVLIYFLLPYISGLTSGIAIGFVGASFPIIMNLGLENTNIYNTIAVTIVAYASGYMGMILSPVHVCLIVTNKHFNTKIFRSIFELIKPAIVIIIFAFIAYYAIKFICVNL